MPDTPSTTPLYDPTQVNLETKRAILNVLSSCRAYDVIAVEIMHSVMWTILCHWPAAAYEWYYRYPAPADMHPSLGMYLDSCGIVVGTWEYFADTLQGIPEQQRQADGALALSLDSPERKQIIETIVTPLLTYPFSSALATWFAAWEAWAQVCNVDTLLKYAQEAGWELTQYRSTLKLIAAWVRYLYHISGW